MRFWLSPFRSGSRPVVTRTNPAAPRRTFSTAATSPAGSRCTAAAGRSRAAPSWAATARTGRPVRAVAAHDGAVLDRPAAAVQRDPAGEVAAVEKVLRGAAGLVRVTTGLEPERKGDNQNRMLHGRR